MFGIVVHTYYYKLNVFDSILSTMENNNRNKANANNENKRNDF